MNVFPGYCLNSFRITERKIRSRFLDSLRLHVKGGAGGMGYPKYGGLGGPGGDVYVVGKQGQTLLGVFKKNRSKRVSAGSGENSNKHRILGRKGEDVIIEAPVGITLYTENGTKLGEIDEEGRKIVVARGGGGGNAENGQSGVRGESHTIIFDLKLVADVALVGFPNAGKSTILSAVSNATPRIASYPFTTIKPTVGMIKYPDLRQISMADLPGLIEGAHANIGMGHKFLKHIERSKLLLCVIDVGGFKLSYKYPTRSSLETLILLNKELELYREDLVERPAILVVNKMDKKESQKIFEQIKEASHNLKDLFGEVPEEFRPEKCLNFERVMGMRAKDNVEGEIAELKAHVREVLDDYYQEEEEEMEGERSFAEELKERSRVHGPLAL